MITSRFIRRNKSTIGWCALVAGSLFFAHTDIQNNLQTMADIKTSIAKDSKKIQALEQQTDLEKSQGEIAKTRYQNGCVILLNRKRGYTNLEQGQTVVDPERLTPLPKGTVICDSNGNTGVLSPRDFDNDGRFTTVVAETAFTGDRDVIDDAMQRARISGNYAQPIQ
ncbi:MAG: hypothetical protein KME22_06620 [Hassallia sp. WJT32-NPBG1]|jgi:hypothetical protein|nr:hypothetical protein [Hassallia sp. WJT32-NPBG1]